MKIGLALVLLVLVSTITSKSDHDLTFEQICEKYGYPLEKYSVTTADGYILQTFRIPHGKGQTYRDGRPVVLYQHGGFDSSDALFNHGPELSPAFYLANSGYDVWIGNARGDIYSRNHTTLNPDKDAAFWDFSFVERYEDDIANFKLIMDKTGQSKFAFVGHSEGATTMLTSLTGDVAEWFKDKMTVFVAVAPVSRMDHMESALLIALGASDFPINLVSYLGIHEWFNPNILWKTLFQKVCDYILDICEFNFYLISEGDPSANDREALRTYLGHFPGGLSVKMVGHELQIYRAKTFQFYDYGEEENLRRYAQDWPPEIELHKISGVPIAMMVGKADLLGDVTDNHWLRDQLQDCCISYKEYEGGSTTFYVGKLDGSTYSDYLKDLVDILDQYKTS